MGSRPIYLRSARRPGPTGGAWFLLMLGVLVFAFSLFQNPVRVQAGLPVQEEASVSSQLTKDALLRALSPESPAFSPAKDWVGRVCFWGGLAIAALSLVVWMAGDVFWLPAITFLLGLGAVALAYPLIPLLIGLIRPVLESAFGSGAKKRRQRTSWKR